MSQERWSPMRRKEKKGHLCWQYRLLFCVWSNAEITLHHNTNRGSWNFTWHDDVYLLRRLFKQLYPILHWARRANIRASIFHNRPGRRHGIPLQVGCRRAKSCSTSEWPSLPVHWHNLSHRTHATSPPWPLPSPSTQLPPIPYLPPSRLYSTTAGADCKWHSLLFLSEWPHYTFCRIWTDEVQNKEPGTEDME